MQRTRVIWVLIGLAVLALSATALRPLVAAEIRWREIQQRGVLRIGIDPGWQPFSYYDAQGWQGYDAALAAELGKRLHLSIQSDPVGYDAMNDALQTGRVDIGLSALPPDPARTDDIAYTRAYFDAGPRLVTQQAVAGFDDLAGQRVGVMLGSPADQLLRHWVRRVPGLQAIRFGSDAEVLAAFVNQQVDGALVDVLTLPAKTTGHIFSPQPRPYVIAVRKDNPALLREINRTLSAIQAEGVFDWMMR